MSDNNDRSIIQFIKASQDLATARIRLFWGLAFIIATIALALAGIYFSQEFIASHIGSDIIGNIFSYGLATTISCLEVSAVFLFGNKDISDIIKESNQGEHKLVWIVVIVLSAFDFATNGLGLILQALKFISSTNYMALSFSAWFIVLMGSLLMTVSEVLMIWAFRTFGTAQVFYKMAKKRYDGYNSQISKSTSSGSSFTKTDDYEDVFGKTSRQSTFTPPQSQSRPSYSQQSFSGYKDRK